MQVFQTVAQLKATSGVPDNAAQVLGYYTPGDGGGGEFYWDPSATEAENGGTIFELTTGGSGRWKRIYNEAINVRWFGTNGTNDSIAFTGAISFCKQHGIDLYLPSGVYDTSIVLDWCLTPYYYQEISGSTAYNPANLERQGTVGLHFNITGESNTTITGDLILRRCREMAVANITCNGNFIALSCEHVKFTKIKSENTGCLAYYSDSAPEIVMHKKYLLNLSNLSDGGCYWLAFNDCFFKTGFVIGGSDQVQHNVINFANCIFNGAWVSGAVTSPSYLDHHGAGLYVKMREGHSDGITLINCDLSYNEFPLYTATNTSAVTMIGCYYEDNNNVDRFITRNGITASDKAATIINGFDYDRRHNQRIELRASRWALSGSRSSSDNYARLMIPDDGGEISIYRESGDQQIGSIVNRVCRPGDYGETIGYTSNSVEFEQKQAMSVGLRRYQNYNTHGLYKRVRITPNEAVNVSLVSLRPWVNPSVTPLEPAIYYGNAHIRFTVVGGIQGNNAGQPLVYEGWSEISNGGNWSQPQLLSGSLSHPLFEVTFSSNGDNALNCNVKRINDAFGYFKGTIHMEVTLDVREDDAGITGWRID